MHTVRTLRVKSVCIVYLPSRQLYYAFYLSASSIGSKLRSAVSLGSLNQDLMGIALSGGQRKKKKPVSRVSEMDMVVILCCSVKEATEC